MTPSQTQNPTPGKIFNGIGLDADGETIWFTGKRTSTVGRVNPDGSVEHFQLNNLAATHPVTVCPISFST